MIICNYHANLDDQGSTTLKISAVTKNILDLVNNNKYIILQELADSLGKTQDGINYHINKLQNQGLLKRVGHDKGGHWEIC